MRKMSILKWLRKFAWFMLVFFMTGILCVIEPCYAAGWLLLGLGALIVGWWDDANTPE